MDTRKKVLFECWVTIPHSYAIVNCFLLIHLIKRHSDDFVFYVKEMPYYREHWNTKRYLTYGKEYNDIIQSVKVWDGIEKMDLIYRSTFPYNITTLADNYETPKCVFYTSEFKVIDDNHFSHNSVLPIKDFLEGTRNIYFTAPSVWSANGMLEYGISENRNRVISHGTDHKIFHRDMSKRADIRGKYGIKDTDFVMLSIGSMTGNKGILQMLGLMHVLINMNDLEEYKLFLKGTGDLYESKLFLESYFTQLKITDQEKERIFKNVIFLDKTLDFSMINHLYNAADVYLSPYIAEGFNLAPLEALTAGLPVVISETGSTEQYINNISNNGGKEMIYKLKSEVKCENGLYMNDIKISDLAMLMIMQKDNIVYYRTEEVYNNMISYIKRAYGWGNIADNLANYFAYILNL